ncbi:MAG: polysaccharide pyruvyl transferase family protein [Acutalibacteraceae bacterium]|nr:polysaccharide pyruvyl transferase family protein [Acutalibacteraceae bacterium]
MKIDIITLHRVRNYGSSLQTLATQQILEELGCNTEIIDYYPERYTSFGLLKRLKYKSDKLAKNPILLFGARVIISFSYIKKKIVFDSFLKKYIKITPKTYRTEKELLEDIPFADAYCTGSDQVWNSYWNEGVDRPLYLSFVPENKFRFSYASSIGNAELSQKEIEEIKPMLALYKHITVRENTGIDIMRSVGFEDVQQMIDPTLLFKGEQWRKYTSDRFKNQKYVVTYNLHHDKRIDNYAMKVAETNGLKVYNITYNIHDIIRKGTIKWCPKIEEYLGLIKDAQYVITDSFHATVFSILFNKKFMVIYPEQASSRIRSILELLNLQNRGCDDMPDVQQVMNDIDFSNVDNILDVERERAISYLKKVIYEIDNKK